MADIPLNHIPRDDRDRDEDGDRDGDGDGDLHQQPKRTPELYARRILAFAKRSTENSIYPGKHYRSLARLLISPYLSLGDEGQVQIAEGSTDFIQFYDLDKSKPDRRIPIPNIRALDEYDDETRRKQPAGRLLFMQGYPSAQWLNHIGSKFDIDPEFFFRHLQFEPPHKSPDHFYMPSLPSAGEIVRIRITSILSREDFQFLPEHTVSDLRSSCNSDMAEYLNNLAKSIRVSVSDSIVRRFSVHDKQHFSVEQIISICVTHSPLGWMALIWLDHGNDLGHSMNGPWKTLQHNSQNPKSLTFLPTIQYRSRIAMKRDTNIQAPTTRLPTQENMFSLPQTALHIASDYGRSLRPEIMESDAFYALDELFRFAIASESQFLEMMRIKINAASISDGSARIEELDAALGLIEEHRQSICENLQTVHVGGCPNWPRAPEKFRQKTMAARARLERDYEYLLNYADRLTEKCSRGITVLMNDAVFRQSQRAIEQTEATTKLTFLAFIFAPLSFTTSFFSMQIREINDKSISIWVWFLFTSLLLIGSFCSLKLQPLSLLVNCRHFFRSFRSGGSRVAASVV